MTRNQPCVMSEKDNGNSARCLQNMWKAQPSEFYTWSTDSLSAKATGEFPVNGKEK